MNLALVQLLLLSISLPMMTQVGALRLLTVSVPAYLRRGESARLECRYDLERDKLYSVSWYKDNEHIYNFQKKRRTSKQTFEVDGVEIDTGGSNDQVLKLLTVSLNSTGYYACEVNTDSKPFKSVKGEAYMEVIEPPKKDPEIRGQEKIYATGDILALNCTSDFSHPEAQIRWFLNDVPIDNADSEVWYFTSRGLRSTRSSLKLEVDPMHLIDGKINVRCESTVQTSQLARTHFTDTRMTEMFVQGHASTLIISMPLLLAVLFLATTERI